ncbi:MAG: thioester reductase domain-containing protein [Thermoanaerobaculia bacterium]
MNTGTKKLKKTAFLTGGTGFLGAFLLQDLAERYERVLCLVRSSTVREAESRLEANLKYYQRESAATMAAVQPLVGDLAKPLLGLPEGDFARLADDVDVIYHNGAWVNFVFPYSKLKNANVGGTQEALRLAFSGRVKPFHYTSSLRIFGSSKGARQGLILEDEVLDTSDGLHTGYSQSKWVAEKLVRTAAERGLPAAIYRGGMVTGDSVHGISNTTDIVCRMLKGCIEIGIAPRLEMLCDMTPVDYVSRAMVELSLTSESLGKIFHMVTPEPVHWNRLVEMVQEHGYRLQVMDYDDWLSALRDAVREGGAAALAPLLSFFAHELPAEIGLRRFDCRHVLAGLAGSDISCPPLDHELLGRYLEFFVRIGFLEPAPEEAELALAGEVS